MTNELKRIYLQGTKPRVDVSLTALSILFDYLRWEDDYQREAMYIKRLLLAPHGIVPWGTDPNAGPIIRG